MTRDNPQQAPKKDDFQRRSQCRSQCETVFRHLQRPLTRGEGRVRGAKGEEKGRLKSLSPSYLANLAFWNIEGTLVEKLAARNMRYSRYVDDVTISSCAPISREDKTWAIAQVMAMMGSRGFRAARDKHSIQTGNHRVSVMNLNVNRKAGFSAKARANLRAMVHQLEQDFNRNETGLDFRIGLDKAGGRIGHMARFHASEAAALRERVQTMRRVSNAAPISTGTFSDGLAVTPDDRSPPF